MEVAEKECGGADKLANAIAANRVRVETNPQGLELYYFPKHTVGKREEAGKTNQSSRSKHIDSNSHKMLADLVSSLGWTIGGSQNAQQVLDINIDSWHQDVSLPDIADHPSDLKMLLFKM